MSLNSNEGEIVPGWTLEEVSRLIKLGFFDSDFYTNIYPDIATSGVNPLIHYLQLGWKEGRQPSSSIAYSEIEFLENIKMYIRNPLELFEQNR